MNGLGIVDPGGVPDPLSDPASAFGSLIQLALTTLIMVAGLYALFNFIFAGYSFLSAGDDPKKVEVAWSKIYQSFIGLAVIMGSFVLIAIVGKLLTGSWLFFANPTLPTI